MSWLSTTHGHNFSQGFELCNCVQLKTSSFKMTAHQDVRYRHDNWVMLTLKCHCCHRRSRCLAGKVFQKPLATYLNLLQWQNFNSHFSSSVLELFIKEIHENNHLQTRGLFFLTVLKQDLCLRRCVTDHHSYVSYREEIIRNLSGRHEAHDSSAAHTFRT